MPTRRIQHPVGVAQRGFTLVEAMVVVAIIGITASMALVYLDSGKSERTIQGFTEALADEFSLARQRAIASQRRQRIVIEADGFSHWQSVQVGLAEVADPNDPDNWTYVFEKRTPRDVEVAEVSNRLHINANEGLSATGLPIEIDVLPDGRARSVVGGSFFESGWTVFVKDEDDKQLRAVLFGVTGTASVYEGW